MQALTGINVQTGREIQLDRSKLINTHMPEGWSEMVSKALDKAMAERAASGEGPRQGINVLIDGEYHFFSFEERACGRSLSEEEWEALRQKYALAPGMNTLWKILAELSRMGVVNGFAAFHEYQMAQRREQLGYEPSGIVAGGVSTVDTLLSRLDNVLYGIGLDRTLDASALRNETEKHETLRDAIRRITGA